MKNAAEHEPEFGSPALFREQAELSQTEEGRLKAIEQALMTGIGLPFTENSAHLILLMVRIHGTLIKLEAV